MKYFLVAITTALALSLTTPAYAANYKLDSSHSFVQFKIQHLGYSWLLGRFNKLEGHFSYDAAQKNSAPNITVTVDTTSIDSNHAERDKHLRKILNVTGFGKAIFKSTGYKGDKNSGVMQGQFTLHGITKDVKISVKKVGEGKDPWGGYRAGFEGILKINRKDFGIDFKLGSKGWDVEIALFIEGIRK